MNQGRLLVCLAFGGALFPALGQLQTVSTVVDCNADRLTRAPRIVCQSEELTELTRQIDELTENLESGLIGAERAAVVDTEEPFLRKRNSCSNQTDSVESCVTRVLELRKGGLEATLANPASAFDEISRYEFFDVPFVLRYSDFLDGRQVQVSGCFTLDPGPSAEVRLTGEIRETCSNPDTASIRVAFDRMDTAGANFFARAPSRSWERLPRIKRWTGGAVSQSG